MSSENAAENRKIAEEFWEALRTAHLSSESRKKFRGFFATEVDYRIPLAPDSLPNRIPPEVVPVAMDEFFQRWPDWTFTTFQLYSTDDPSLFMVEYTALGHSPSGNATYANNYVSLTRIRDGKVIEFREYFDSSRWIEAEGGIEALREKRAASRVRQT